jgi:hypothetical protein
LELFAISDRYDKIRSDDHLTAEYNGIPFEQSDVLMEIYTPEKDKTITWFRGTLLAFDYPNKRINSLQLYSKGFSHRRNEIFPLIKYKVNMENVMFNNVCDVFSPVAQDAFYILTPQYMERLIGLFKKFSVLGIHLYHGRAYVAFKKGNHDTFDTDGIMVKLSRKMEMKKIQQDIDDVKMIIDTIRER